MLVAIAGGTLTASVAPAVAAAAATSHLDCVGKDVVFIGARGSGEQPHGAPWVAGDPYDNVGPTLGGLYSQLFTDYPRYSWGVEGVAYPAAPVTDLLLHSFSDAFLTSTHDGGASMALLIDDTVRACPNAALVIAGYSQGAWSMHQALNQLSAGELGHIAAVVAYGDPVYQPATLYGRVLPVARLSPHGGGIGLLESASDAALPGGLLPSSEDLCMNFDPVCHGSDPSEAPFFSWCLPTSVLLPPCPHYQYARQNPSAARFVRDHLPDPPRPVVATTDLRAAQAGVPYSDTLLATGAHAPVAWSLAARSRLPAGLSLNPATGVISGTPTLGGDYLFGVRVRAANGTSAVKTVAVHVFTAGPPLTITSTSVSAGTVGQLYLDTLAATGGAAPYTWTVTSGALPDGIQLSLSGVLSGTPTTAAAATPVTVQARDAVGIVATAHLAFSVSSAQGGGGGGRTFTVDALVAVGPGTEGVAVDSTTHMIYVAKFYVSNGDHTVSVIDGATNTVSATIDLGPVVMVGVTVDPTRHIAYVVNGDQVSVIDGATNAVSATIPVGLGAEGVAIDPATNIVYTANSGYATGGTVSVIDATTNTVSATFSVGRGPTGVAVDPTTHTVYVTNAVDSLVSVIEATTNTVSATISVGRGPTGVAVDPTTHTLYVANALDNTLSVIDETTNAVSATIPVGTNPAGVAVDPTTHTVYVTNAADNTLSVIDGTTNAVSATIPVGRGPEGVAVDPSTHTAYIANSTDGTVSVVYSH